MHDEPRGLGGWLLFFTVTLGVRCLLSLVSVFTPLSLLGSHPASTGVLVSWAAANLGGAIYTGWMALTFLKLNPEALRRLPPYFAFMLAYGCLGMSLPYFPHDATLTKYLASVGAMGISMLVYIGVWIGYFKNSRRVANTFGRSVATA